MEYTVVRDNENPHWNSLLRNVRQLNDELRQLSNYYLGNNVMATITDHEKLPKATSNIANACLEVTDATCVVMATMRAIIKRQNSESENIDEDDKFDCQTRDRFLNGKSIPVLVPNDDMFCVMSYVELALLMSRQKRGGEVEHLLRHAMSMIKNAIKDDHNTNVEEVAKKGNDSNEKGVKNTPTKLAKSKNQSKYSYRNPKT